MPMPETTLLLSAVFSLLTGLVYTWVGVKVGQPGLKPDEQRAVTMFKIWWHTLAGVTYVSMAFTVAGAFDWIDLAFFTALLYVELGIICLALWGLTYYLAFLFTGKPSWFIPMGVFYGVVMVWLFYIVVLSDPAAVSVGRWQVTVEYANPDVLTAGFSQLLILVFIGPSVLGAIGYFSLFFRTKDPNARYRIGMVSLSLLTWLGSSIVASLLGINEEAWWSPVSRVISLAAAFAILMAYQPPAWVRRRLAGAEGPVASP